MVWAGLDRRVVCGRHFLLSRGRAAAAVDAGPAGRRARVRVSGRDAAGLPGGWLGIGLDAFGNFSNPQFGSGTCPEPSWAGFTPNEITVRGPGHGTSGYCLLSSSIELADNPVGQSGASLRGVDRASSARTIQIVIDPLVNTYTVNIDPLGGSDFVVATSGPLPSAYYDPESGDEVSGIPPRITFGFAASTGSATDIHEITSLQSETINGAVPVLTLTKTHDICRRARTRLRASTSCSRLAWAGRLPRTAR